MGLIYFFDTYALIEIIRKSEEYKKYTQALALTTINNLMELHYVLLKELDEKAAEKVVKNLSKLRVQFNIEDIKRANFFRRRQNTNGCKISYIDALGYTLALKHKIKFLTGDKEFKGLPNIEFVR